MASVHLGTTLSRLFVRKKLSNFEQLWDASIGEEKRLGQVSSN